jgi:response regulator RpfG family c-di-GMP phosphodiesterase
VNETLDLERELYEETLPQTARVLIDVIGLIDPATHYHTVRISERVTAVGERMGLEPSWEYRLAATVSQLGMVAMPPGTVEKYRSGETLRPADQAIVDTHAETAYKLLVTVPRLERVARMVLMQHDPPGSRPSDHTRPDDDDVVAIGAHLLDVVQSYEQLLVMGMNPIEAIEQLREGPGLAFRYAVIDTLAELGIGTADLLHREVMLPELEPDMILNEDLRTTGGLLLLAHGTRLTPAHLKRVGRFAASAGLQEPIDVLVADWD